MKLALRFCLGLFASLALTLLVVSGVRAQDTSTTEGTSNNPAVTTSEAEATTQSPTTTAQQVAEQSPEVKAQKAAECESMGMKGGHPRWMEGRQGGEQGMMGMPMMGDHMAMMRMIARNPKMAGRMLEMRADMMRAIADVMTKYGKEMESGDWQAFQTSPSSSSED